MRHGIGEKVSVILRFIRLADQPQTQIMYQSTVSAHELPAVPPINGSYQNLVSNSESLFRLLQSKQMEQIFSLSLYMDWHWLWLTVAAFLAGVLNAVAGGGSFLLFPAMLSMKILPVQANATNAVALWPGQLTSVAAYRDDIRKNLRLALPMGAAGLIGGTAGAIVLLSTPQ